MAATGHIRARSALIYQRDGGNRRKVERRARPAEPKTDPTFQLRDVHGSSIVEISSKRGRSFARRGEVEGRQRLEQRRVHGSGPSGELGRQLREMRDMVRPFQRGLTNTIG